MLSLLLDSKKGEGKMQILSCCCIEKCYKKKRKKSTYLSFFFVVIVNAFYENEQK